MFQFLVDDASKQTSRRNDDSLYQRRRITILEDADYSNTLILRASRFVLDVAAFLSVYNQHMLPTQNTIPSDYATCPARLGALLQQIESSNLDTIVFIWLCKIGLSVVHNTLWIIITSCAEARQPNRRLAVNQNLHGNILSRLVRIITVRIQFIGFVIFDLDYAVRVLQSYLVDEDGKIVVIDAEEDAKRIRRAKRRSFSEFVVFDAATLAIHIAYILETMRIENQPRVAIFYVAFVVNLVMVILTLFSVVA